MAVYVGQLFNTAPYNRNSSWRWVDASHMQADTVEELHKMAAKIGLKRAWFQARSVPHYDLTKNMRRKALAAGAKSISFRQEGELIRDWRQRDENNT